MPNPYDQFDSSVATAPTAGNPYDQFDQAAQVNPYDQFDGPPSDTPASDAVAAASGPIIDKMGVGAATAYGQRMGGPTTAEVATQMAAQPQWLKNAQDAAAEVMGGFVPKSAQAVAEFLTPLASLPAEAKQLYGAAHKLIAGEPLDQVIKQQYPESQQLAQAEQTPAYSKERFAAGFGTVANLLMAHGLASHPDFGVGQPAEAVPPTPAETLAPQPERPVVPESAAPSVPATQLAPEVPLPQAEPTLIPAAEQPTIVAEPAPPEAAPPAAAEAPDFSHINDVRTLNAEGGRLANQTKTAAEMQAVYRAMRQRAAELQAPPEAAPAGEAPPRAAEPPQVGEAAAPAVPAEVPVRGTQADVAVAREAAGLDPYERGLSQSWGQSAEISRQKVARYPGYEERLAQEIDKKPRPVTADEHVSLLRNWQRAEVEHQMAVDAVNAAPDAATKGLAQDALASAKENLQQAVGAVDKSGSAAGRGFNARQMILREFYSPERMAERVKAAKGGKALNETEVRQVEQHVNEMRQARVGSAKVESQRAADARYAEKANGSVGEKASKARTIKDVHDILNAEADAARQRIVNERGSTKWTKEVEPCIL